MQRQSDTELHGQLKRRCIDGGSVDDYCSTRLSSHSNSGDDQDQKYIPTLFDQLMSSGLPDVVYDILDWLDINSLCAFSKTCKSLWQIAKAHFALKYPSLAIDIGDEDESRPEHFECFGDVVQHLQLSGASFEDFTFGAANVNPNLRELSFNRTNEDKKEDHIGKKHIDSIQRALMNVKDVCATSCIFEKGAIEYLFMNCKRMESFGFAARKDITYRFQFHKVSTLKTIDIAFEAKAKVMEILQTLQTKRVQLDELVLSFLGEHSGLMNDIFNLLDAMFDNGIFMKLYLNFDKKSMIAENVNRLTTVKGLVGVICAYRINNDVASHTIDLAMLYNLKYLAIHWMFTDSTIIAKQLTELVEIKMTEATIEAIVAFVRYAPKLAHFHIKHIKGNRMLNANILSNERGRGTFLIGTKLKIYIPERIYIKMKWSSIATNSDFVEIKREESYVPKKRY